MVNQKLLKRLVFIGIFFIFIFFSVVFINSSANSISARSLVVADISVGGETAVALNISTAPENLFPHDYCYNWDLFPPDPLINDLHITLLGPTAITDEYLGQQNPFGQAQQMIDPQTGALTLWYQLPPGVSIPPIVHIGFCTEQPIFWTVPDSAGLPPHYWTIDGQPVFPTIPMPGIDWWWLPEPDHWQIGFFHHDPQLGGDIVIDGLQVAVIDDPIPLEDLTWDNVDTMGLPWDAPRLPQNVQFNVDSFFDIAYQIDFGQFAIMRAVAIDANNPTNPPVQILSQARFEPPPPPIYCYNWDLFNNTGLPANDLHLGLKGPRELSNVYMHSQFGAPDPTSGYDPNLDVYELTFSGAIINPGDFVHIGFCTDQPLVEFVGFPGTAPHYWTWNGNPIPGPIPLPGVDWWWLSDGNWQLGLMNGADQGPPLVVEMLEMVVVPDQLPLDDLLWDNLDTLPWIPADLPLPLPPAGPGAPPTLILPPMGPPWGLLPGDIVLSRMVISNDNIQANGQPGTRLITQAVVPPPPTNCYNWDFYNWSGVDANDLHIGLLGPTTLTNVYTGASNPFGPPDGSSGFDPNTGAYSLNFSGATVSGNGGLAHIGFCSDNPVMRTIGPDGLPPFYWTFDGKEIPGPIPLPGWDWWWLQDGADIGIFNDTGVDIIVNTIEVAQLPDGTAPIMLNDLVWDPPGVPLIWVPVTGGDTMAVGDEAFFDVFFDIEPGDMVLGRIEVVDANNPDNVTRLITQGEFWPPPPPTYCYNWDFFNNTGQDVNDLHMGLKGIREISDVYMGSLNPFGAPHPMSGYDPALDAYFLWFDGAVVSPGGLAHIGFCTDQPLVEIPGFENLPPFYWTIDGQPVPDPDIPLPGFDWWWLGDGNFQFGLSNGGNDPLEIVPDTLQMAWIEIPIPLDDLVWDQVDAQIDSFFDVFVDVAVIPPGEMVLIDIPEPAMPGTTVVARFEVNDPTGNGQATRMLAQAVVPPPPRYCYNWDFYNQTGHRANDLHIGLLGPTVLTNIYTGSLNPFGPPDGTSGYNPVTDVYSLNFSGGIVEDGGLAHIGFCSDRPVFRTDGEDGLPPFYWTWNGEPLPGNPPLPGWDWWWVGGRPDGFELGLFNDSDQPMEVVSLSVLDPGSEPFMLNDLTVDTVQNLPELWNSGGPATIPPGGESFFDVTLPINLQQDMPLIGVVTVQEVGNPNNQVTLISQALVDIPPPPLYCYNWDFFNTSTQVANDLHIALAGPTALSNVYMGGLNPFGSPHPMSGYDSNTGLYLLWYDGADVQPGSLAHIGFCSDNAVVIPAEDPNHPGLPPHFWTQDGVPIGEPIPLPGWDWWWHHEGGFEIILTNPHPSVIEAVLVEVAATNNPIPLDNLVAGHPDIAALTFETVAENRIIPNLGSSGKDGVSIDVPFGGGNIPAEPADFYVGHVLIEDPTGQTLDLWTQGSWLPPPPPIHCYNWDFFNNTGEIVNDLHLALNGPTQISDIYMGQLNPFGMPDPQSGYHPESGLYLLWWSGRDVLPGELAHIGFCTDQPIVDLVWEPGDHFNPPLPPFRWTRDGEPVGDPIPIPGYDWWWMADGSFEFGLSLAEDLSDMDILDVEIAPIPQPLDLDDLTYDLLGVMIPPQDWMPLLPLTDPLLPSGGQIFFAPESMQGLDLMTQTLVLRYRATPAGSPPFDSSEVGDSAEIKVAAQIEVQRPSTPILSVAEDAGDMVVTWPEIPDAVRYEVWRSELPYDPPGSVTSTLVGSGTPDGVGNMVFTDPGSNLGNVPVHTFYTVVAYNAFGQPSIGAGYVGEFEFTIVPGSIP